MTAVSGHGPWPGGERDVLEAQQTALDEMAELPTGVGAVPFLTQLPERGPGADALGRTAALLAEMPAELGPHGWKLTERPGADARRAETFWREDLGALAIAAHGHTGPLTVEVLGPWTLAAQLWSARKDRVLADTGARRDLGLALAESLRTLVSDITAQVPGVTEVTVQLSEPLLGQVHAGVLPTFSGFSRLRAVAGPEIVEGLEPVLAAVRAAGARSVVHLGSTWVGVPPVVLAGADALGLDLADVGPGGWNERAWELLARALERGTKLWAGLPPVQVSQCAGPAFGELADLVGVPWRRIGLTAAQLNDVTLLAAPRTSLGSTDTHRAELANLGRVAEALAERAEA